MKELNRVRTARGGRPSRRSFDLLLCGSRWGWIIIQHDLGATVKVAPHDFILAMICWRWRGIAQA